MCGIAGILSFDPNAPIITGPLIEHMRDTMVHRGPDDAGLFRDDHIALGQRRLSIIDLSGGQQPMTNADQSVWVLNNGEIYNYQDIRKNLESSGYIFRTQSDTEAVLAGYCAYGESVAEHLRGMFAAAIWDVNHKKLTLIRDRAGQKPLYYAHLPEGLFFASEIKALLQYDKLSRQLDEQALADYFAFQSIPAPLTIFKHIKKLPPAHLLTCNLEGHLNIHPYWTWRLDQKPPQTNLSYDEAVTETRRLIEEAVKLRMISDVPLGALLSGGVDSSAVVAMMARHSSGGQVKTFSIGFSAASYDERPYARQVAGFCNTDHQELVVEPENLSDILPRLAHQYDEPFADTSALPTYYVCKMAREHVTVALAGDGGDEGFGGYGRYVKFLNLARFNDPLSRWGGKTAASMIPFGIQGRRTVRLLAEPIPKRYQRMNTLFEARDLKRLLAFQTGILNARPLFSEAWQQKNLPILSQLQAADFRLYLPSTVLVKVDRASMLNSLEVRAPLLDHHLLDFIGTLPAEWMLGKRVLKDAVRGLVPDDVLTRPKAGFGTPLEYWFKGDFGAFMGDILLDHQTRQRGLLNVDYVEKLLKRQSQPWGELSGHLWAILMFELWCRAYNISL